MNTELQLFHEELKRIQKTDSDHTASSKELSNLVKKCLLTYNDILENPEKFFSFHAAISEYIGLEGFGIRFTVQYNLFAGSVMALGLPHHKELLIQSQKNGDLGCFMLTEYNAGVLSGMLCNTIVTTTNEELTNKSLNKIFTMNTLTDNTEDIIDFNKISNKKNWISQGLHAKYAVVIAKLVIDSIDHGIHPFFINMKQDNIHIKSNGEKTIANSLDNAMVIFKDLKLSYDSLMYPFDEIYLLRTNPNIGFKRLANRLNSGRLCISFSMTRYLNTQFNFLKNNIFTKTTSLGQKLESLPEIYYMLRRNKRLLNLVTSYVEKIVNEYCQKIKNNIEFDNNFLERIMVAKILVANFGFKMMNELKVKMGSNSLFAENGMGSIDILLCARFAEGDNDILLEKLLMDRMKKVKNVTSLGYLQLLFNNEEQYLITNLAKYLSNNPFYNNLDVYKKLRKCKEIIIFNIISNYVDELTMHDIKSML